MRDDVRVCYATGLHRRISPAGQRGRSYDWGWIVELSPWLVVFRYWDDVAGFGELGIASRITSV